MFIHFNSFILFCIWVNLLSSVKCFSSSMLLWLCGAFLGADDIPKEALTEDRLRASSDSPSVHPMSSLELDSALLTGSTPPALLDSTEGSWRRSSRDVSLARVGHGFLFCSEECEDRDSRLPIGVLLWLLLIVSPKQGPGDRHKRHSLKLAVGVRWLLWTEKYNQGLYWKLNIE